MRAEHAHGEDIAHPWAFVLVVCLVACATSIGTLILLLAVFTTP